MRTGWTWRGSAACSSRSIREETRGGAGNQPCYVQSVTFGRMVVYTVTSTEATSASELRAAVQASYGAYEGSGEYNAEVTFGTLSVTPALPLPS